MEGLPKQQLNKTERIKQLAGKFKKYGLALLTIGLFGSSVDAQNISTKNEYQARDSADYAHRVEMYDDSSKLYSSQEALYNRVKKEVDANGEVHFINTPEYFAREKALKKLTKANHKAPNAVSTRHFNDPSNPGNTFDIQKFRKPGTPIASLEDQEFYKKKKEQENAVKKIERTEKEKERREQLEKELKEAHKRLHKPSVNFPWLNEVFEKDVAGRYQFHHYEDQKTGASAGTDYGNPISRVPKKTF